MPQGPDIGARRSWGSAFRRGIQAFFEAAAEPRMQERYGPDWRERLAFECRQRAETERAQALAREEQKQRIAEALAKSTAEELQGAVPELGGETPAGTRLGAFDVNLPEPGTAPTPEANLPRDLLETLGVSPGSVVSRAKGKLAESRRTLQQLRSQAAATRAEADRAFRSGQRDKAEQLALTLAAINGMISQANIRLRAELRPSGSERRPAQDVGEMARALETVRDARSDAYRRFAEDATDRETFLREVEDYTDREAELLGTAGTATGEQSKMRQRETAQRAIAQKAAAQPRLKEPGTPPSEPAPQPSAPTPPRPAPTAAPATGVAGQPAIRYQRNRRTGEVRYSTDGGATWQPLRR